MTPDNIRFFDLIFKGGDGKLVPVFIKDKGFSQTVFVPKDDWNVAHAALIQEHSGAHIFYGIGLLDRSPTQGRGASRDVSVISAFYWDVDVAADDLSIYADRPTPRVTAQDIEAAFAAIGLPLSAVTSTGNGFHAYVSFEAPLIFTSDEERVRAAGLWKSLTTYVRHKLSHTGWKIDNVADLARLDRLVGSTNHKGEIPRPVTLDIFNPMQTHRIEDLEVLVPVPIPMLDRVRLDEPDYERPDALADFNAIHAACSWVQHCIRDAATLSEPEWFTFMRVLAHCNDGEELAHRFSEPYPGYSRAETAKKFQHAKQAKPPLYSYIRSILDREPEESFALYGTVKSPISLGYIEPELAAMLARYAYVASEDRFVRLDTFEPRQRGAFDAENLHRSGVQSPARDFLRSPIAIKVERRDYLPGQARLVSDEAGGLVLNSHRPSNITVRAGDWSAIKGHFEALFPNEGDRNAIYDRFAMAVQKPGTKVKSGVLIFGPDVTP